MEVLEVQSVDADCTVDHFTAVADIVIRRPHVIRSRMKLVAGAKIISQEPIVLTDKEYTEFVNNIQKDFLDGKVDFPDQDFSQQELDYSQSSQILRRIVYKGNDAKESDECVLWIRDSDSRVSLHILPLGIVENSDDFIHCKAHFCVSFDSALHQVNLSIDNTFHGPEDATFNKWLQWLRFVFLAKVVQWCNEKLPPPSFNSISLKLVPLDKYQACYSRLKQKYFDHLAENWKTESTNPEKFIHEDLAIASYLVSLWEDEESKPKSFIDLGCGNGLLVYILTQEGFQGGVGLDLRRRKIWDFFEKSGTDLRVQTFVPKPEALVSDYDWVIGNHSDELTPWIPLICSLSRSKFFLLPCCSFDFFGKFQRKSNKTTIYREYLEFVRDVGERCGFVMEEDRLRIPSTKRICFVGRRFQHTPQVDEFVNSLANQGKTFEARPLVEEVRNCTRVAKDIQNEILQIVVDKLLSIETRLDVDEDVPVVRQDWNAGGTVPIAHISELVPKRLLDKIKNECGGLQTLFRNHRHLFVVEKGTVRIRPPVQQKCDTLNAVSRKRQQSKNLGGNPEAKKLKPCWFHINHPQGCPVSEQDCTWHHEVVPE